jgi:hypothetical protein
MGKTGRRRVIKAEKKGLKQVESIIPHGLWLDPNLIKILF